MVGNLDEARQKEAAAKAGPEAQAGQPA
jgi:hypothetical protein